MNITSLSDLLLKKVKGKRDLRLMPVYQLFDSKLIMNRLPPSLHLMAHDAIELYCTLADIDKHRHDYIIETWDALVGAHYNDIVTVNNTELIKDYVIINVIYEIDERFHLECFENRLELACALYQKFDPTRLLDSIFLSDYAVKFITLENDRVLYTSFLDDLSADVSSLAAILSKANINSFNLKQKEANTMIEKEIVKLIPELESWLSQHRNDFIESINDNDITQLSFKMTLDMSDDQQNVLEEVFNIDLYIYTFGRDICYDLWLNNELDDTIRHSIKNTLVDTFETFDVIRENNVLSSLTNISLYSIDWNNYSNYQL